MDSLLAGPFFFNLVRNTSSLAFIGHPFFYFILVKTVVGADLENWNSLLAEQSVDRASMNP